VLVAVVPAATIGAGPAKHERAVGLEGRT
jgi:hypothetical protein